MRELVLYLDIDVDGADATELGRVLNELEDVSAVNVESEEAERGPAVDLINSFTVVVTASAGAVGASAVLLERIRALLNSVHGVREAWVKTSDGPKPIDEVQAGQGPEYENPAQ